VDKKEKAINKRAASIQTSKMFLERLLCLRISPIISSPPLNNYFILAFQPAIAPITLKVGQDTMERIDVALTSREALARELPRVWWRKVGAQVINAIKTKLKQPNRKLINHNSRLRSTV